MISTILNRLERLAFGRKAYKWVLRDWLSQSNADHAAAVLGSMGFVRQIEPQLMDVPDGQKLLIIAPHPDDEVIGPGGTVLRAVERGIKVRVLYLTSGIPEEQSEREAEAVEVCRQLGAEWHFLRQRDGALAAKELMPLIVSSLKEFDPDTLFLPFLVDDNEDHREVSAALAGLDKEWHRIKAPEVWAYQIYTPIPGNIIIDITEQAAQKADLIRCYASQMRRRDWAHFALGLNAFNCRLLRGQPKAVYLETFFVIPMSEYLALCRQYYRPAAAGPPQRP